MPAFPGKKIEQLARYAVVTTDLPDEGMALPGHTTLRCRTVASGGFKQINYVRSLAPFLLEERFGAGDDAQVATASETLLAALGSCLSARIYANAAAASIAVHGLELDVEADRAASSMWEPPGHRARKIGFESIRVAVHIQADASPEALRTLVAHAVMWSPVANTLHDPVHLDVSLGRAA